MKAERLSDGTARFAVEDTTGPEVVVVSEWVFGPPPKSYKGTADQWYDTCKREALLLAADTTPTVLATETV